MVFFVRFGALSLAALVEVLWGGINHAYPDSPWCNQKIMLILMSILHSLLPLSLVSPSNICNEWCLVQGKYSFF